MIEIRGAEQLATLSKRLKEAGDKDLKKELSAGIRQAMEPLKQEVRQSALRTLPQRGGLARRTAKTSLRVTRSARGIRLVGKSSDSIRRMNSGTIRHPVFGNRSVWVDQRIPPGWWDRPTQSAAPQVRADLLKAMDRVARKI